jgi:hypothetical protein
MHVLLVAADGARQQLAEQIQQHTAKAKQARVDEAVAATEVALSKIIAVNAVELLSTFPADLWKQLHSARKQVECAPSLQPCSPAMPCPLPFSKCDLRSSGMPTWRPTCVCLSHPLPHHVCLLSVSLTVVSALMAHGMHSPPFHQSGCEKSMCMC